MPRGTVERAGGLAQGLLCCYHCAWLAAKLAEWQVATKATDELAELVAEGGRPGLPRAANRGVWGTL